ncbi:hypothetical protein MIND_00832800 [Mycena indigotica]|uniref:Uncharacterized protein n=1 Tax=Mycena indigotica TaxID=2126181 RepID=A0A8H6SFW7_9AGAR|nr:uncharacterized protein MIND_00832800 [Mycena indigotica]KAF7298850.1 hypothetical protein MIND_00832800 [Mycena indigotica]
MDDGHGEWAGMVFFTLTRWCGVPWTNLIQKKYNTQENKFLVGRTLEALHDMGVEFTTGVITGSTLRHVLLDLQDPALTSETRRTGHARCYIVGFGDATMHHCKRMIPVVPHLPLLSISEFGCEELRNFCCYLYRENPPTDTNAYKLVEWHLAYAEKYGHYHNSMVLMVQRKLLFPDQLPIYPGISIAFEDGDETYPAVKVSDSTGATLDVTQPLSLEAEFLQRILFRSPSVP